MPAQSLAEFAASFERNAIQHHVQEAEKQRARLLELFPRESIAALPLEKYAIGLGKGTLCYEYEFGSPNVGSIRGGSAGKHGVYFSKDGVWRSGYSEQPDAQQAWLLLRAGLLKALAEAEAGEWEKVDDIPFSNAVPALRTKLLHGFFPEEVLPIFARDNLRHFLIQLGQKPASSAGAAALNRQLLELLRKEPALQGWSTPELERLLYSWRPPVSRGGKVGPEPVKPQVMKPALNQILYGPPGTGKTYWVIRRAACIVAGQVLDDGVAKQRYDEFCAKGYVRLATFHQSFSYEDFMEGIRPVMDDESGRARFEVRDGVFKEIATEALFACLERVPGKSDGGFDARWSALLSKIAETGELEISGLAEPRWLLSETAQGNVVAVNKTTQKEFLCGRAALGKVWSVLHPKAKISSGESTNAYGKSGHHHVIAAVYNFMQTLKPPAAAPVQTPAAQPLAVVLSYLELGSASGWQLRADGVFPPFVLIIDEINRGNISRIFGELITLIEDDKRHGAENALRVTLPSSREPFTVPPNLFLLGTMNTADKSLALLDVALRRRFDFEELAPNFDLCLKMPDAMRTALKRLNERIELRKDRDHRIGHAFFMQVSDAAEFNAVFHRKVVPLLQEYFFNDTDGVRYVLGEIGREGEAGFLRKIETRDTDAKWHRTRWRWFADVEPKMDCWARLQTTLGVA